MNWLVRHRRALAVSVAALTAIIVVVCVAQQLIKGDGDPVLFANAGKVLLAPPNDLYLSPIPPHNNYYYYPPFFAVLCMPLSWLPESLLLTLWALASVALLGWSLSAFYGGITGKNYFDIEPRHRWMVIGCAAIFVLRPAIDHLRFGQINIFVLAAAVLALLQIERRREFVPGLILGASIVTKLLLIPFAALFLLRRKYVLLLGMAVVVVAAAALPALFVGLSRDVALHREWFEVVFLGVSNEWTSNGNISLAAQITRFFTTSTAFEYKGISHAVSLAELSPSLVAALRLAVPATVLLVIGFFVFRFRNAPALISRWGIYALVFALVPCFSTITELPHLVLLAPAAMWVAHVIFIEKVTDRLLVSLFAAAFVLTTLTSKTFVGEYLGKAFASTGIVILGVVLLSVTVVRGLYVLQKRRSDLPGEE